MTGKNNLELEWDNRFKRVAEIEQLSSNKLSLNSSNISIAVDGSVTNVQLQYINSNIKKLTKSNIYEYCVNLSYS